MVRKTPTLPMADIAELCRKYGVKELAVFGSILGDDFGPESDIDFLVTFENDDAGPWMNKLPEMEEHLGALLGRKVDVVLRKGIQQSRNWIRRRAILESAIVVYEA
jgi:predicted nucleotidyltransferase